MATRPGQGVDPGRMADNDRVLFECHAPEVETLPMISGKLLRMVSGLV